MTDLKNEARPSETVGLLGDPVTAGAKGVEATVVSVKTDHEESECHRRNPLHKNFSGFYTRSYGMPKNQKLGDFQGDLISGFTVALTVIPQSLAYARIAELPPQYGLYTAFMCYFAYTILGTARDVSLGPTAVMSLLTAEFAHQIPALASLLAFLCGAIQLGMGLLSIGFLVDYISHSVINSFTTAAAITIACSQVKKWLGLRKVPRSFVQQAYWTLRKLPETQIWDFVLGLVCIIILYILKRLREIKCGCCASDASSRKKSVFATIVFQLVWFASTARNAIVVIATAGLAAIFMSQDAVPFSLTGNITSGVPPFRFPDFSISDGNGTVLTTADCFSKMGIGIVIVPLVSVIEIIAVGKAFGRKNGYNIVANQELLAIGSANILGSFVSAYPVTASFSRSAVAAQSGVRTTMGNVFTGSLVLLALAFLTPLFYFIPDAALAAVIIMAVTDMIDFSMIPQIWAIDRLDLIPWFTTFLVSLLLGFEYGILLGIVMSLVLLLYPWARPRLKAEDLKISKTGIVVEQLPSVIELLFGTVIQSSVNQGCADVLVVSIPIGLLYPSVEFLQEKIIKEAFQDGHCKSVILDFCHIFKVDYTTVLGIKQLFEDFKLKKSQLVIINAKPSVMRTLGKVKINGTSFALSTEDAVSIINAARQAGDELAICVADIALETTFSDSDPTALPTPGSAALLDGGGDKSLGGSESDEQETDDTGGGDGVDSKMKEENSDDVIIITFRQMDQQKKA